MNKEILVLIILGLPMISSVASASQRFYKEHNMCHEGFGCCHRRGLFQ